MASSRRCEQLNFVFALFKSKISLSVLNVKTTETWRCKGGVGKEKVVGEKKEEREKERKRVDEEDSKDSDYGPHLMLVMRSFDTQFN